MDKAIDKHTNTGESTSCAENKPKEEELISVKNGQKMQRKDFINITYHVNSYQLLEELGEDDNNVEKKIDMVKVEVQ